MAGVDIGFNEIRLTTYLLSGMEAEKTGVGIADAGHRHPVVQPLTSVEVYLVIPIPVSLGRSCRLELLGVL